MNDRDVERHLRALRRPAPPTLVSSVLRAVGLDRRYGRWDSPLGPVVVAWTARGVVAVSPAHAAGPRARDPLPAALARTLDRSVAGDVPPPVDLEGVTVFERAVLEKAVEIPRGEVRPYAWVAREIGRPRAVRAVGSALARNPVPLLVPCHRVVRADGRLGDYALGPPAKRRLLEAEGLDVATLDALAAAGVRVVAGVSSGLFCHPSCANATRLAPGDRLELRAAADAREAGFVPCPDCRAG